MNREKVVSDGILYYCSQAIKPLRHESSEKLIVRILCQNIFRNYRETVRRALFDRFF